MSKQQKVQRHTEVQVFHEPEQRRFFEIQERIVERGRDLSDGDLRLAALDIVTRSSNLRIGPKETSAHQLCTDAEEIVRYLKAGDIPAAPVDDEAVEVGG